MADARTGLDAQAQRSWRRFAQKLEQEGNYSTQQILNAHRYWLERYNRGIRDDASLEQAGRFGLESVEPEPAPQPAPEPTAVDLAADEAMEALAAMGQPREAPYPDELTFGLEETGALDLTEGLAAEDLEAALAAEDDLLGTAELGAGILEDLGGEDLFAPDTRAQFTPEAIRKAGFLPAPQQQAVPDYRNPELAARIVANQDPGTAVNADAAAAAPTPAVPGTSMGWKDYSSLGLGLAGQALGALAPELERDRAFEAELRKRAGGSTVARQEGALAAGQLARGIQASSLGRRDISPALAMRNAQMAAGRAASNVMAQTAIASARERQAAQQQLADIRRSRRETQINAGLGALSQVGGWLAGQAASERQGAKDAAQLKAVQERNRLQAEQNRLLSDSMTRRPRSQRRDPTRPIQPIYRGPRGGSR